MKHTLQTLSVGAALCVGSIWLLTGASRGWTKTSVPVKTLDEITGIEAVNYERKFVPGLDFLGSGLLGAGVLAGVSAFSRNKKQITI